MSRGGSDDYDEEFPGQAELWWASAQRALKGKRGRKALAELREALLALPQKRLVQGAISTVALEARALAMPDEKPLWGSGRMVENYEKAEALEKCAKEGLGVCAIGAYLWWLRVKGGETPEEAMANLPSLADVEGHYLDATASLAKTEGGLVFSLAYLLADRNDETYRSLTPEQRYEAFLAWLNSELAAVPA